MDAETKHPFSFHTGLVYEFDGDDQFYGTCPFCEKEQKFYFTEKNGDFLWDCKNAKCVDTNGKRRNGNSLTYLRSIYEEFDTLSKAAELVSEWRGLPRDRIMQNGLKFNHLNGSIIIPTFKHGKISGLYRAMVEKTKKDGEWVDKLMIKATPSTDHTIMHYSEDLHQIVWVCEGHWDKIAGDAIVGLANGISCIGAPGSNVWKSEWTRLLADKDVVFCYDNDAAGRSGFERVIIKEITRSPQKPRSISYISWPEGLKEGYDLNDTYQDNGRKSLGYLKEFIKPYKGAEGTVVVKNTIETVAANKSIDTYDKLLHTYRTEYHTNSDTELALLFTLSSIYSLNMEGEQIWGKIISRAGAGKSTLAKILSASPMVVLRSTFKGLFSGYKDESGEDAGLIPVIAGKLLFIKDADTLMQQENIAQIFSEFRDFYDKDSSVQYRNMELRDYRNIRATVMIAGTNVLRRSDQKFLGERFLDFEIDFSEDDEHAMVMKAGRRALQLSLDPSALPPETAMQAAAKGFIDHMIERPQTYSPSERIFDLAFQLSYLISRMRAQVDRDTFGKGDITFNPVPEMPTRLIGQLLKLVQASATVTGGNEKLVEQLVRKVSRDIIDPTSTRYRACQMMMEGFYTRDQLSEKLNIPPTSMSRILDDIRALKLVDERPIEGSMPGKKRLAFTLNEKLKQGLLLLG